MTDRRIPDPTLMARLQLSVKGVDWAASLVSPFQHQRKGDGWTAHQQVSHLIAQEAVFQERIRRALAEDSPVFERWDSEQQMRDHYSADGSIDALAEQFMAARNETYELFKAMTPEQWSRTFTWPDGRRCDLTWLGERALAHALHHFAALLELHGDFEARQAAG